MRRSDAHECRRPETSGGTRGGHDDSLSIEKRRPAGAKLSRPWRDRAGAAAGAGPLRGRDADRQSGRRDAEGALDHGRRGLNSRRGHPRFAHTHLPLRDRDAAFPVPRAQRRRSAAARVAAHGRGSGAGAHLRCRHAADFRSRLPAGGGGRRCGPCGDRRPRRFRGARGALRRGPPDRPVFLRRFFAAAERGAAGADQRACRHPRNARLLRGPEQARRDARRSGARTRAPARGGGARTYQAARGGAPRPARRARG